MGVVPGIVTGKVAFHPRPKDDVKGKIIYCRMTDAEHMKLLKDCLGVICTEGGPSSHAAIVCRMMNKPCIVAFSGYLPRGSWATMNGKTGEVIDHGPNYKPDTGVS